MNTRRITKAIGKGVMITLSSNTVLAVVEWLGRRKERTRKKRIQEARDKARR